MSTARLEAVATDAKQEIPMQPASVDIWDKKYRLKTKQGVALDADIDGTYKRVAKALSEAEPTAELQQYWQERFTWALRRGAIPAGRITSNAGAQEHKPATSTINCTVSGTIEDSMDGILDKVHEAGLTLKAGCGIGYEFSTLRPRGAFVAGAGAYTSGPMSFMDIYDKMCFTVSSAGGRRGAQMGTFDVSHPDVKDFIRAKREDGRLRQFNLSLLITDGFMQAVESDADWPLVFPVNIKEKGEIDLDNPEQVVWREWPTHRNYIAREVALDAWKNCLEIGEDKLSEQIMD
jgi:ribonucleoside-diphosphate reductase alpha chain